MKGRKEWLRQHEENPHRTRLKSKGDIHAATKLETEKTIGGRFKAPKMKFVTKEGHDPALHGEWDQSKVVKQTVFGEEHEGIWVKEGKDGVFDYESYEDRAVKETTTQHDADDSVFAAEALGRKRKANEEAFHAAAKARASQAVQGHELTLTDLLGQLNAGLGSGLKAAPDAASGHGSGSNSDAESIQSTNSDEEDSEDDERPLASFFGASSATAKAKAKAKAQTQPAPKTSNSKGTEHAQKPKAKPKRVSKTGSNKGDPLPKETPTSPLGLRPNPSTPKASKVQVPKESKQQDKQKDAVSAEDTATDAFPNLDCVFFYVFIRSHSFVFVGGTCASNAARLLGSVR